MRTRALRAVALSAASAILLSGCGLADARQQAIANAQVKPVDMAHALRPGLVGMPDFPATGWEPTDVNATPTPSAAKPTLATIGLQAGDVAKTLTVKTIPDGTSLGVPSLDFCEGNYASESLRVKRLQKGVFDAKDVYGGISSEVVVYRDTAAAMQAIEELQRVKLQCPTGKEITTVDGHTLTFTFHPAPGPANTPLVDAAHRMVVHVTMQVDGKPQTALLVYQVDGRVLVALYATDTTGKPFPQATLDSFLTLAGDFANRLRDYTAAVGTEADTTGATTEA